jgi:hypothetical protein
MRHKHNFGGSNMTKSLLVVAGSLLIATSAWAIDAPSPSGSGNNIGGSTSPVNTAAPAPAPASTPSVDTYHAQAPEPGFNPAAYRSTTDCLNAAEVAHAQLGQCERGGSR